MKNKFNNIALTFYLLVTAVPLIFSFGYAALYSFGLAGIFHHGFTLANWSNTLSSSEVLLSFLFSFYVAAVSMVLTITAALLVTSVYRKSVRESHGSIFVYLPLALPAVVAAFLTFQMLSKAGVLSRLFFHAGWITDAQNFPDLIHDKYGVGIIATHIMMALPFFAILFTNLNESENLDELRNLSRTLGAGLAQTEYKIVFPILLRKAFSTIASYFIFVLGSYEIPLLLGRQYPQMISVLMIRKLQRFNLLDIPTAYTMAVLYLIFAATILIILLRKRKLSYDL